MDSNNNKTAKKPKTFKQIVNELQLIDAYRQTHKIKKDYTFFKIEKSGNIIQSRIDYILVPLNKNWENAEILPIDKTLSRDHRRIEITLHIPLKKPNQTMYSQINNYGQ